MGRMCQNCQPTKKGDVAEDAGVRERCRVALRNFECLGSRRSLARVEAILSRNVMPRIPDV